MNMKIIKWLLKKAYKNEINLIFEIIKTKEIQIKNLKERLKYAEQALQTMEQRNNHRR